VIAVIRHEIGRRTAVGVMLTIDPSSEIVANWYQPTASLSGSSFMTVFKWKAKYE